MQNDAILMDSFHQDKHTTGKVEVTLTYVRGSGGSVVRDLCTPQRRGCYCHIHRNCAGTVRKCKARADGHKEQATFSNIMGGSNRDYD